MKKTLFLPVFLTIFGSLRAEIVYQAIEHISPPSIEIRAIDPLKNHKIAGKLTMLLGVTKKYFFTKKYGHIDNIYVKEAYRSQGIGSELMTRAMVKAKEKNLSYVTLGAFPRSHMMPLPKLVTFYEKFGFKPMAEITPQTQSIGMKCVL